MPFHMDILGLLGLYTVFWSAISETMISSTGNFLVANIDDEEEIYTWDLVGFGRKPHGYSNPSCSGQESEWLEKAAEIFTDVMHTNLGAVSLAGGEIPLMKFEALAILRAGVHSGEYYEATNKEGDLIGYAMWMPPGQQIFSTEDQKKLGYDDFMSMLSEEARIYFDTTYMEQYPSFVASLLGPTGQKDSWWLHMAMIHRDYQRKGVLRALLRLVQEKAARSGETLATCTTSDENIRVYTGLGFEYKGSKTMSSPWGEWPIHVFKQ